MNLILLVLLFVVVFPNSTMSIQSILVNHLLMNTCRMLGWDKVDHYLIRFDVLFTRYVGIKYCLEMRRSWGDKSMLIDFVNTCDNHMSRGIYRMFKPILAGPINKK